MPSKSTSRKSSTRKKNDAELPAPGAFSKRQAWSRDDHRILRQYYPTKGAAWVARELGRTEPSVSHMAARTGLSIEGFKRWTPEESEYLIRNYNTMSYPRIAEALGRSVGSVTGKAAQLRHKAKSESTFAQALRPKTISTRWNEADIEFLRENYGAIPTAEIAAHVGRSVGAVINKVTQLGINYPHLKDSSRARTPYSRTRVRAGRTVEEILTASQKRFIRKSMHTLRFVEIARRLNLPYQQVYSFARRSGYVPRSHGEKP